VGDRSFRSTWPAVPSRAECLEARRARNRALIRNCNSPSWIRYARLPIARIRWPVIAGAICAWYLAGW
jgi:hypothetical protein